MIIIYALKNKLTNIAYVGQSVNPNNRKSQHFSKLRKKNHKNENLQKDFDIYGQDSFYLELLSQTEDAEKADCIEKRWIAKLRHQDGVYNIASGGVKSFEHNQSSKDKMKKWHLKNPDKVALRGKDHPWYGTKGAMHGKKHTEETKEKIRQASLKYRHSEEVLKKMSEVRKGISNINHPNYIKVTDEMKDELINGMKYKTFCDKYNCSRDKVKRIKRELKKQGLMPEGFSSKYKGISYDKTRNQWKAIIFNDDDKIYIGRFKTELEAHEAYEMYDRKLQEMKES